MGECGSDEAIVLVLGAGIVGVSTALHLQARGRRVVLVDRGDPGMGTSFGNAGLIERASVIPYAFPRSVSLLAGYLGNTHSALRFEWRALPGIAPWLWRYWRESAPAALAKASADLLPLIERSLLEHEVLVNAAGVQSLVRRNGWIEMYREPVAFEAAAAEARSLSRSHGLQADVLAGDALRAREPGFLADATLAGGIHWLDPWTVSSPAALVDGYARLFVARGGALLKAEVRALVPLENRNVPSARSGVLGSVGESDTDEVGAGDTEAGDTCAPETGAGDIPAGDTKGGNTGWGDTGAAGTGVCDTEVGGTGAAQTPVAAGRFAADAADVDHAGGRQGHVEGGVRIERMEGEAHVGGGWRVLTSAGELRAREVVVALGPDAMALLSPLGYRLPLVHKRGYHLHFRPGEGQPVPRAPLVDSRAGFVLSAMAAGVRLTTGVALTREEAPPDPSQLRAAERIARSFWPLGEAVEAEPWMGRRPCFPDMRPVIGPAPRHAGLWFNFGHAHHGLTLGPVTGRLLAEMMTGEKPLTDPAPFSAARFGG